MTRRFEFIGGNSAKFYEVTVADCDVTVRYGRLGTNGQSQTKSFADAAKAQKQADAQIVQKIGKGYRETTTV
jgi:predicted DNA-binding WGR domain protein